MACYSHLAHELTAKCVDDTSNGRGLALADVVEVEHTLHSLGLQPVDEASRLVVEKKMLARWTQWPRGSTESLDVLVRRVRLGREAIGGSIGTITGPIGHRRRHFEGKDLKSIKGGLSVCRSDC